MKKNIKYFMLVSILSLFMPLVVNAADIKLTKDSNVSGEKAKFFVIYTKSETDTDDKVSFEVEADSKVSVTLSPGEDVSKDSVCNEKKCTIILPTGNTSGVPFPIATINLENTSNSEVKPNLKVNMNDTLVASENDVTLSAKKEEEKAKSNDSTLKTLAFSVSNALLDKTFDPNTLEYTVTGIKDTINSISINTTCENCDIKITCPSGGCSISNNNKVALQTGANQVAINVTSEDGTSNKTYMLNIYRGDVITSSPYLQTLQIKDATLSPTFSSLVNDYTAKVKKDVKNLEITATPEDPSAKIEIKGDKNLKDGENTVTITVTSSDGENKQVYTIIVTKEETKKITKKTVTTKVKKKKNNTWLIILLAILALGLIIGGYFFIFKRKKKNNKDKNEKGKGKKEKNNTESNNEEVEEPKENIEEEKEMDPISEIEKENTDSLQILEETKKEMENAPKQDIDEALDDLMKTKKLELGDLDF